jgi:hypothetical protein
VGAGMFQRRLNSLESSRKFSADIGFPIQRWYHLQNRNPLGSLLGFDLETEPARRERGRRAIECGREKWGRFFLLPGGNERKRKALFTHKKDSREITRVWPNANVPLLNHSRH